MKEACDGELVEGATFRSDTGIMLFNEETGEFFWKNNGESVVAMRDDLEWEEV